MYKFKMYCISSKKNACVWVGGGGGGGAAMGVGLD